MKARVDDVLQNALDARRRNLPTYKSLQSLNDVVGTEYGNRVLYELIQNAHDAHQDGDEGRIAIRLDIKSESSGVLYVANGGSGFRDVDVEAITNVANSAKHAGEGIGNKGLGFRSVEALTEDVHIYSCNGTNRHGLFDGYCFRFARTAEIEERLLASGEPKTLAHDVASDMPRYSIPRPLTKHPAQVQDYAHKGYATVIELPLRTKRAVELASEQVDTIANLETPLLLFLSRLREVRIDVERPDQEPYRRRLTRTQTLLCDVPELPGTQIHEVHVGRGNEFIVVRHELANARVIQAVKESIEAVPQLKSWVDWKGTPVVSLAVGKNGQTVQDGRLYNFLPMGEEAECPFLGYLDAPFFANINRRDADLSIPLNAALLAAAATACAAAITSIIKHDISIPGLALFDLFAWTGEHASDLEDGFNTLGCDLQEVEAIPCIPLKDQGSTASLAEIWCWPDKPFSLIKPKFVASRIGIPLVPPYLQGHRLSTLGRLAQSVGLGIAPEGEKLAQWSEDLAKSLQESNVATSTWARFYNDVATLFHNKWEWVDQLKGKNILYDRDGKMRPAGIEDQEKAVFVRSNKERAGNRGAAPLPPQGLARRYRFMHSAIKLKQETQYWIVQNDLVREYDPVAALSGLHAALQHRPNDERRMEALTWAFQVWCEEDGKALQDAVDDADLDIPTRSGWRPAKEAIFSATWTPLGKEVESYLTEAATLSPDCEEMHEQLVVGWEEWPASSKDGKKRWIRFLQAIGVTDGLRMVYAKITAQPQREARWCWLFRQNDEVQNRSPDWLSDILPLGLMHPQTEYKLEGNLWRFPGQAEYASLSQAARTRLCILLLHLLKDTGDDYLDFQLGRFERTPANQDVHTFPTPLATFLRLGDWVAAIHQGEPSFHRPEQCWAARERTGCPPHFIAQIQDPPARELYDEGLADLIFGDKVSLRDWGDETHVVQRLSALAEAGEALPSHDRRALHNAYHKAWQDALAADATLPPDLPILLRRGDRTQCVRGTQQNPTAVFVTADIKQFEAKTLLSAGKALLEVSSGPEDEPARPERVAQILTQSGAFRARCADERGVQLLVDGQPFVAGPQDPALTSLGLDWLPELIAIGHELRGEALEKAIPAERVEERARAIRVRMCSTIELRLDDEDISPTEQPECYAFPDKTNPTLIILDPGEITWRILASTLSRGIVDLIDRRLKSLEAILLRLQNEHDPDDLTTPTSITIARALESDEKTVEEYRAQIHGGLHRVLEMLAPVASYCGFADAAKSLRDLGRSETSGLDIHEWARLHCNVPGYTADELLSECKNAPGLRELRRTLDLDYETFNLALQKIDYPSLANTDDLKQQYYSMLKGLNSIITERLRRHYYPTFTKADNLSSYVEDKNKEFLKFNEDWIVSVESLTPEIVERHVGALLDRHLGADTDAHLPPYGKVLEKNRKALRKSATEARPIVDTWCQSNSIVLPEPWRANDSQVLVKHLEDRGWLDFDGLDVGAIPSICRRAGCWPDGMPESIDLGRLGLRKTTVEKRKEARERERTTEAKKKRTIDIGGRLLDVEDPMFDDDFRKVADDFLVTDDHWLKRCRRQTRLVPFDQSVHHPRPNRGGAKHNARGANEAKLPEATKHAMGLLGERVAYKFLEDLHGGDFNESCWVSRNRAHDFGGDPGDDSLGYDFRVTTKSREWLYEVKASLADNGEFEMTANELRVAGETSKDGRHRYRILYVPAIFTPEEWCVLILPNPVGDKAREKFKTVGRGSVRLKFERKHQ